MPMVAWYMLSNESYMKRVMRDVLPTVVCLLEDPILCSLLHGMGLHTALLPEEDESVPRVSRLVQPQLCWNATT